LVGTSVQGIVRHRRSLLENCTAIARHCALLKPHHRIHSRKKAVASEAAASAGLTPRTGSGRFLLALLGDSGGKGNTACRGAHELARPVHCPRLATHRRRMPPMPPVTQALLLVNAGVFCLQFLAGQGLERIFALWPLDSGFLPWQVVTYSFLHGGVGHLFFNMLGLWMFGAELERLWGPKRFLQFYAASVLSAAGTQLLVSALTGSPYPTVGASGGLFGLLLAFGMLFPNRTIMPLFPPIPMKAKVFVALYGGLELLFGVTGTQSGIAHFAHLGGMLGGFLMIRYWRRQPPFGRR
jgi:membrane associated rhomboid family serine protease